MNENDFTTNTKPKEEEKDVFKTLSIFAKLYDFLTGLIALLGVRIYHIGVYRQTTK